MEVAAGVGDGASADAAVLLAVLVILGVFGETNTRKKPRLDASVLAPRGQTDWDRIDRKGDDRAFVCILQLDRSAFDRLHAAFAPIYSSMDKHGKFIPRNKRRPKSRQLNSRAALAAVLMWLTSCVGDKHLCIIFGVLASTMSSWRSIALHCLDKALDAFPEAQVVWPDEQEMERLSRFTSAREPLLSGIFGFVDGLNLQVQTNPDPDIQNSQWNHWCGQKVSSVIIWLSDGMIGYARCNYPGSFHDSCIAHHGLYQRLNRKCPPYYAVAGDSAFPTPKNQYGILVVDKDNSVLPGNWRDRRMHVACQKALISVRQAAEWGMGTIQATIKRLTLPLSVVPKHRALMFSVSLRFLNFRTTHVGLNQIRTVFRNIHVLGENNPYGKQ